MASILKRGDSYFIAVSCGYDQNGRQIRRTMTYKPDKNLTEKQVQKEVQRQAVLFEEQVRNGQVSTDGRLKLADFVPMYLETARQKLSPYVYERYTHILDIGIIPALGHLKLRDIRPLHIQRFIDDLSRRDTHLDGKPGKLSSSTVRRYYTMISSLMKSAFRSATRGGVTSGFSFRRTASRCTPPHRRSGSQNFRSATTFRIENSTPSATLRQHCS